MHILKVRYYKNSEILYYLPKVTFHKLYDHIQLGNYMHTSFYTTGGNIYKVSTLKLIFFNLAMKDRVKKILLVMLKVLFILLNDHFFTMKYFEIVMPLSKNMSIK